MKLGIVCVYMVCPENRDLLDLHLRQIERHTTLPYAIYGNALDLDEQIRRRLDDHPKVRLVDLPHPPPNPDPSVEHGIYLDELTRLAFEDGCTHVATLHLDSFPVRRGWETSLIDQLTDKRPLAGVMRTENFEHELPNGILMLMTRDFYHTYQPRFWVSDDVKQSHAFKEACKGLPLRGFCGLGYAYCLNANRLDWIKLTRSNARNDHFILGAIYGDVVFHLGAAAQANKAFRQDDPINNAAWFQAIRRTLRPGRWAWAREAKRLAAVLCHRWMGGAERLKQNQNVFEQIRSRVVADPDGYLNYLRTGASNPQPAASPLHHDPPAGVTVSAEAKPPREKPDSVLTS